MKFLKTSLVVIACLLAGISLLVYWAYVSGRLQKAVVNKVTDQVTSDVLEKGLLNKVLGFEGTRTYLILFLNNTEMRPGGGFIGAYGLLQVDNGVPHLLKVEGTEILDNSGNKDFESVPPAPLAKYLKVSRWYFRDSNWSPDFSVSAQKSIDLFLKQGGLGTVPKIDAVIGFTPTVIEEILKIHGPIKINGEEFNADNFTEKLEYEVEYGYSQRGLEFSQRKDIIHELAQSLMTELRLDLFKNWQKYYTLLQKVLKEKQIVMYSSNNEEQAVLSQKDWAGKMKPTSQDYVLWADANLGSLKTDVALDKELTYTIVPDKNGRFVAKVKMKFKHKGSFNWRISRYRDYARVFVPVGSELIKATGAMDMEKSSKPGAVDQGIENGRQWFGAFIAIEPGQVGELSFEYYLPEIVVDQIRNNNYELTVQKEIGTIATKLTLGLDFGKKLISAYPGEAVSNYGDNRYDLVSDLREDRIFNVKLKN